MQPKMAFAEEKADGAGNSPRAGFVVKPRDLKINIQDKGNVNKELEENYTEHNEPIADTFNRFNVPRNAFNKDMPTKSFGLSQQNADERRLEFGPNVLAPVPLAPAWYRFGAKLLDPINILLFISGTCSVAAVNLGMVNLYIALLLWGTAIFTACATFLEEQRALNDMESIKNLLPQSMTVYRDGQPQRLPSEQLVCGDIVLVSPGDKVGADLRLLWVNGLQVECSALTGESEPVICEDHPTSELARESHNLVFNSALALEGEAVGIVVRIGDNTLLGNIAVLTAKNALHESTLSVELRRLLGIVSVVCVLFAGVTLPIASLPPQSYPIGFAFTNSVVTIFADIIPQGLPIVVTTLLSITISRLVRINVYCKTLHSIETLGSASVICSDKTGTLTYNKMTASHIWTDTITTLASTVHTMRSYKDHCDKLPTLEDVLTVAAVCNRASFADEGYQKSESFSLNPAQAAEIKRHVSALQVRLSDPQLPVQPRSKKDHVELTSFGAQKVLGPKMLGDASDQGLMTLCHNIRGIDDWRSEWNVIFQQPFNSRNKFSACIVAPLNRERASANKRFLFLKGAPEVVLARCSNYKARGAVNAIDKDFLDTLDEAVGSFARNAERVLGFAMIEMDGKQYPPEKDLEYNSALSNYPLNDLTFLGLITLQDPPREGVKEAVSTARRAGIKFVMVTGDHAVTAEAIAKQVGIITQPTRQDLARAKNVASADVDMDAVDALVIEGKDLVALESSHWDAILQKNELVFARTTPAQKLEIVTNLQRLGHIVAVTGDGVNDAPALRKSNIGIAMGQAGSDVARDAANVVLLDDNFPSIIPGIMEGRVIFDNLTKVIAYTLSHLTSELLSGLILLWWGMPLGLSGFLMLTIDLGSELLPSGSLAYEPAEGDVMLKPPRIFTNERIGGFLVWFYGYVQCGIMMCALSLSMYLQVFHDHGIPSSMVWGGNTAGYFQDGANDLVLADGTVIPADEQVTIAATAMSAWYVGIIMFQVYHIWMVKLRYESCFTTFPRQIAEGTFNWRTFPAVCVEVMMMLLFVYLPSANNLFGTAPLPGKYFAYTIPVGIWLVIFSEGRRYIRRNWPGCFYDRWFNF